MYIRNGTTTEVTEQGCFPFVTKHEWEQNSERAGGLVVALASGSLPTRVRSAGSNASVARLQSEEKDPCSCGVGENPQLKKMGAKRTLDEMVLRKK
jgi:hypothetical protein